MATQPDNWYIGSDNVLRLDIFRDEIEGEYLNSATVTATVRDLAGNEITGVSWPITLTYVASSNGRYQATVDAAASVTENSQYYVYYTAVQGSIDKQFRRRVIAVYDD